MSIYRDIQLKREERLDRKQDKLPFKRAVLVTSGGLQTAVDPFTDVWAAEDERRVWYMTDGATQPGQILCRRISDPYVGLGVIIGYADGSNEQEVLTDDFFLTKSGDPTAWHSTAPRDFEPGGRKQLWVYPKVITPLATYPDPSGLTVNVIRGDYPYAGTRKTFEGEQSYLLTAPPTSGHHYYAGLYLDSSNTLQVVYGTSVALAFEPIEPAWPASAFRLSVVLVENGQTSIDFAEDVYDRRMAWSDEVGGGGWPFTHVITVSTTNVSADYATLATAIAGASAGDIILIDPNDTHTLSGVVGLTVDKALTLMCIGPRRATITNATNGSTTISVTAAAHFVNLNVTNTGAGGSESTCAYWAVDNVIWENCTFTKTGAASIGSCLLPYGGASWLIKDCEMTASGATTNYALRNNTATTSGAIRGGKLNGSTQDIFGDQSGSTITLTGVWLANNLISFSGTLKGGYYGGSDSQYQTAKDVGAAVYHNTTQAVAAATEVALNMNSERRDTLGFHDTVTNNTRLTIPAGYAGWYSISGNGAFAANATGTYRQLYVKLNGSTTIAVVLDAPGSSNFILNVSTLYYLAAGDYVELFMNHDASASINSLSAANYVPEFRIARVGL